MSRNYYETLGVPANATKKQVRERFLELAKSQHPDRFQDEEKARAEVEFQEITEAFNSLIDPERRRLHDLELKSGQPAGPVGKDEVAKAYLERGIQAFRQGEDRAAIQNFDSATQENPTEAEAWFYLAQALAKDRRSLPRARAAIAKACELRPMEAGYLKLAGTLFAESGMDDKARGYFQRALDWGGADVEVEEAMRNLKRGRRGGSGLFGRSG